MLGFFPAPQHPLRVDKALLSLRVDDISGTTPIRRSISIMKGLHDVIFIANLRHTVHAWRPRRLDIRVADVEGRTVKGMIVKDKTVKGATINGTTA